MMTDTFPSGVQAAGKNQFVLWPAPPASWAAPKLSEYNAATNLDITCYIPVSAFAPTLDQPTEDDTRWCDKSTRNSFGVPTLNLSEITHIVNPQGTGSETGNKMLAQLLPDTFYYLSWRLGVEAALAGVVGQKIVGFSMQTGAAITLPMASGKYVRTVKVNLAAVTSLDGVALVAA